MFESNWPGWAERAHRSESNRTITGKKTTFDAENVEKDADVEVQKKKNVLRETISD